MRRDGQRERWSSEEAPSPVQKRIGQAEGASCWEPGKSQPCRSRSCIGARAGPRPCMKLVAVLLRPRPMDTAQTTLWGVIKLASQSHTTSLAVSGQFNEGQPSCLGSGVCLPCDNTMHSCLPVHLAKTISSPWTLGQPHPRPAQPP